MKITVENTFHNTETNVLVEVEAMPGNVDGDQIVNFTGHVSRKTHQRVLRKLCGSQDCKCGGFVRIKDTTPTAWFSIETEDKDGHTIPAF